MITLNIETYCENCSKFEAETVHIYAGGDYIQTIVSCEHKHICMAIAEQLKERQRINNEKITIQNQERDIS